MSIAEPCWICHQQRCECVDVTNNPCISNIEIAELANKTWDNWVLNYEGKSYMTKDLFTLAIQDVIKYVQTKSK